MITDELEAARFVRAALDLIAGHVSHTDVSKTVCEWAREMDSAVEGLEQDAPPWEPERPEIPATWGSVCAGDSVLAPNGQWYEVDSWSRTGKVVKVLLSGGITTTQDSATPVTVRRGPAGQAMDVFTQAGFEIEAVA